MKRKLVAVVVAFAAVWSVSARALADDTPPPPPKDNPTSDAPTVDLKAYQAYEDCTKKALIKNEVPSLLKMRSLNAIRKESIAEAEKCASLLPPEALAQKDKIQSTVIMLTEPTPKSGVEKGQASVTAGAVVQTTTGASLLLQGDAELKFPKSSVFSLTDGSSVKFSGNVLVGTTATGQSVIPAAKVSLQAGRTLEANPSEDDRKALEKAQINMAGVQAARLREIFDVTFDRSIPMDRPWDVAAGYGRELTVIGENRGVTANAMVQGGIGQSGDKMLPYLRLTVGGNGYLCKQIAGPKHLVCATANIAAGVGIVQAKLDLGLGADYRYVAADPNDSKKWFHSVSFGPSFTQGLQADLAGGHAATQGVFAITVR